jgi:hypothetical protein
MGRDGGLVKKMNTTTYSESNIEAVRSGQRWVITAIAINLGSIAFRLVQTQEVLVTLNAVIMLTAFLLSLFGLVRLTGGLKYPLIGRICCYVLMLVPLVNIVTLAIINRDGTRMLREHGHTVGLFGAKRLTK